MLSAGVDLGGTKIQSVILKAGKVVGSARILTPQSGVEGVVAAVAESVNSALHNAGADPADLSGTGIGTPGTITGGSVANSPNVPGFASGEPVPLAELVSKQLRGVRVAIDNDVRVAVLGEQMKGAGRPYSNFLGVFVGTGVGGGLVIGGARLEGGGAAGEIGHTLVKEGGRRCGCGKRGCLEAYAGRARMAATAEKWQAEGRKTKLFQIMAKRDRERVTSGVIAAALAKHDPVTEELVDEAVWALGIAIANAQNLLDLEAVIIGGGLGDRLGRPFVDRIAESARPRLHVPERAPKFLTTELGDLAGAVGAALLGSQRPKAANAGS